MNIPSQISTLIAGIALTLVSLWYGYHHGLMPVAASLEAPLIDDLFDVMMTISTGIFLIVQGSLIWIAFRHRRIAGDTTDAAHIDGNIPLEIVWTAIPAIIVLGLSLYSFDIYEQIGGFDPNDHSSHLAGEMASVSNEMTTESHPMPPMSAMAAEMPQGDSIVAQAADIPPSTSDRIEIGVSAMQFAFLFNYPDRDLTVGELHVPLNKPVLLNMTAVDVIHAFWVPEFRLKQDIIPGRTTQVRFTASKLGTYPLICAELCGSYHGIMRAQVVVDSEADYQAWLDEQAIAQLDGNTTIATRPLTDAEFLQSRTDLSLPTDALHALHTHTGL